MKTVAAIQVRMGSTRLPGKALADIEGKCAIEHIADRLRHCPGVDVIAVATSARPENDALEALAERIGVECVRGSETDVVQRFLTCAQRFEADALLRVTGDCPLVDPALVDRFIGLLSAAPDAWDLVTNAFPATYPDGYDLELFPTRVLERLDQELTTPLQREWFNTQVMEHPDRYRIYNFALEQDLSGLRVTLDFAEDLELIRAIYRELGTEQPFGLGDVLALFERRPELIEINAMHVDQTVIRGIRSGAYHALLAKEKDGDTK